MGNGGHIPRALTILAWVCACFSTTACVDLAEPNVPSLNSSTVFNITVRQIPRQGIDISGTLSPGRDSIGVPRRVLTPLIAVGRTIPLGEPNAQRTYIIANRAPADSANFVGPFEIQPPVVENTAQPQIFRWYGLRRLDGDTVRTDALGDVSLHVQTRFGTDIMPNRTSQWFLELRGSAGVINVSGSGAPPDTLRIPSQFLPAGTGKRVDATLIYFQSATIVSQPVPYIASVTLDVRTEWIILLP